MDTTKLAHLKTKLEKEAARLLAELKHDGRQNPLNPNDWEGTNDLNPAIGASEAVEEADELDQGVQLAEFGERTATEETLEIQYKAVTKALEAMKDGTYGTCKEGNDHSIEPARLEANPSADTCIEHMK